MNTPNKTKKAQPGKRKQTVQKKGINSVQSKKKAIKYITHEGHALTKREAMFIDSYMEHGNQRQAVIDAGYTCKAPGQYAQEILKKPYIANEITYRMEERHRQSEASGQEVMEFFAAVMRGEIKDQFQLEASLADRIKAGQEIAKRTVDIANKIAGVKAGEDAVTIKLDWSRKVGE